MAWEQYTKGSGGRLGNSVNFSPNVLTLSFDLWDQAGRPTHVAVYYDEAEQAIGLDPSVEDGKGMQVGGRNRAINIKGARRHFGLSERGRFPARIDGDGWIIVDLQSPVEDS